MSGEAKPQFSADEIRVMRKRRHGWEKASCALLAAVFNTTPQHIAALTKSGGANG